MAILNWLSRLFSNSPSMENYDDTFDQNGTNPATGLPMVGAYDIEGNPYGFDLRDDDRKYNGSATFEQEHYEWDHEAGEIDQFTLYEAVYTSSDGDDGLADNLDMSLDSYGDALDDAADFDNQFESSFDLTDSVEDAWSQSDDDWATGEYEDTFNGSYDNDDDYY